MPTREAAVRATLWVAWRLLQGLAVVVMAWLVYRLFGFDHRPIARLDMEVYRMGAQAWLHGAPLYGPTGATTFITEDHTQLAFLYPPIAAILFTGFAMVSLPTAGSILTAISLVLLTLAAYLVLDGLDVWPDWTVTRESATLRRAWLALLITGVASFQLEPIWSNYGYGQINAVSMALVLADCLPRRTLLPRGACLGLAIALKLTAAVMIPYFMIKRDWRAVATTCASFGAATAVGFIFDWRDSVDFWVGTLPRSASRVANISLNTNESIYSFLSRLSIPDAMRGPLWLLLCALMLAVTVWAMRRAVAAGYDALAVSCAALLGLLASPISWTHHWVWVLPVCMATAIVGYRERNFVLLAVTAAGLMAAKWPTLEMLPSGREWTAGLWDQICGVSYVWWALAVIVSVGLTVRLPGGSAPLATKPAPATVPDADVPEASPTP